MLPGSLGIRKGVLELLFVVAALLAFGSAAKADSVELTVQNVGAGLGTGPFGTVNYTLAGNQIDVSVTMNPGFVIKGLAGDDFAFNVVGSTTGLAVTNLSAGSFNLYTNQNISGFGTFEFALNHIGSANLSSLSFTVSRTGGFTSADDLWAPSSGGAEFAAHIVSSNGNTGYVAAVPESSMMVELGTLLLCLGLLAIGGVLRPHIAMRQSP
jgi:hypothetical protein